MIRVETPARTGSPQDPNGSPSGHSSFFSGRDLPWLAACVALYLLVAVVIARRVTGLLNHDAVSYLSLARHWLEGHVGLGVTGTWSPLLSWFLAAVLQVTPDEAWAVRVVMAASGLAFVVGAGIWYARESNTTARWIAGLLTAVSAAATSGALITPDLLGAGLFLLGFAAFVESLERPRAGVAMCSGVLLGVAYLAKAIFLPLAVSACVAVCALHAWSLHRGESNSLPALRWRWLGIAALAFLVVVGPWVAALSVKYERFTVTRATLPQWAFIGPQDIRRDQPTNIRFFVPEVGRQSQFEDESILPLTTWSPLQSAPYFTHYVRHIGRNLMVVQPSILRRIDFLGAGFVALLAFAVARVLRRRTDDGALGVTAPWPLLAVPTLLLLAAYALNFGDQLRYYLVAVPGVYLGALVGWQRFGDAVAGRTGRIVGAVGAAAVLTLTLSMLRRDLLDHSLEAADSRQASELAAELDAAGLRGPVATVGMAGLKHPAIYLSYFLRTTYNGTEDATSVDEVSRSCARLLVLDPANSMLERLLSTGGRFVRVEERAPSLLPRMKAARYALLWDTRPPDPGSCRPTVAGASGR